ncbi:hypothetical protein EV643_11790 [Kribbella sp. VKM Ac-2527]|uniref:Lipoprotein n=2 Tax=Kribbella caucasensis TaxID=2512215 RepID=A0A4R6K593_9ACTN|nr:hypothetical protein EV643_11790 [Kribbella sp. VKM Ac-2527]
MRRKAPGMTAVLLCAVLGVSGCAGGDAGALTSSGSSGRQAAPAPGAASAPADALKGGIAGLIVVPKGYVADSREMSGPFKLASYLDTVSAFQAEDRALLLNATFTEGYQAARMSPDRQKQYTVQLFKTGSAKKAKYLQLGFWNQQSHTMKFAVPGVPQAFSDQRVGITGTAEQSEAVAEVSFVVGAMLVQIRVRQVGELETTLVPDTALARTLAKQQYTRLTSKSG